MTAARMDLEALASCVARRIMASFAEVTAEIADDALARAGCSKLLSLRAVDQHLAEHPSALIASSPHVPMALVRLAHALNDLGISGSFSRRARSAELRRTIFRTRTPRVVGSAGRAGETGAPGRVRGAAVSARSALAGPTAASAAVARRPTRHLMRRAFPAGGCAGSRVGWLMDVDCARTAGRSHSTNALVVVRPDRRTRSPSRARSAARAIDILSVAVAAAAGPPGSTIAQPRTCRICAVAATPACRPSARSAAGSARAGAIATRRILCATAADPGRSGSAGSATSMARSARSGPRALPARPAITRSGPDPRPARIAPFARC